MLVGVAVAEAVGELVNVDWGVLVWVTVEVKVAAAVLDAVGTIVAVLVAVGTLVAVCVVVADAVAIAISVYDAVETGVDVLVAVGLNVAVDEAVETRVAVRVAVGMTVAVGKGNAGLARGSASCPEWQIPNSAIAALPGPVIRSTDCAGGSMVRKRTAATVRLKTPVTFWLATRSSRVAPPRASIRVTTM